MKKAKNDEIEMNSTKPDTLKDKIRKKYFTKKTHYIDKVFRYNPELYRLKGDIYFEGYWQSEKFFFESRNEIKQTFSFPEISGLKNKELINKIDGKTAAIHVRRGDYLKEKYLFVCDKNYYKNSIDILIIKYGITKLIIFSNAIVWCRDNLNKQEVQPLYCNWNTGADSWKDMA